MNATIDIKGIFLRGLALYKEEFPLLINLGLIYALSVEAGYLIIRTFSPKFAGMVFLVNILISAVTSIALLKTGAVLHRGKTLSLQEAYAEVGRRYLSYVAVSMIFFVLVLSGVMMLVVPGIYFGTVFVFADLVVVLEEREILAAFQRSMDLVRGHFRKVFFFSLVTTCFLALPSLVLGHLQVGGFQVGRVAQMCLVVFAVPYVNLVQVGLYNRLKEIYEQGADTV